MACTKVQQKWQTNYLLEHVYRTPVAAFAALVLMALCTTAQAATITVNALTDPGTSGNCSLRAAITAANSESATDSCVAGTGNDTINFSVTGTITLGTALPAVKNTLTIDGTGQAISISGNNFVQLMTVNSGANLTVQFITLTKGLESSSGSGGGGAIMNSGTLTVANCTVSSNQANGGSSGLTLAGEGGAILNAGTLTVYNSTFASNTATGGSNSSIAGNGSGGAIYNTGTLTILNSTFSANVAVGGAGLICGGVDCEAFYGASFGGAIYTGASTALTITNSTFAGNQAKAAGTGATGTSGAIYAEGPINITNSTFSGNKATAGGAIDRVTGAAKVQGSILAADTPNNCKGTITDEGYNLSDDASCSFSATGSENSVSNLDLDTNGLQDNGGPTETIAVETGSAAIDAIPSTACTYQGTLNPCTVPPSNTTSKQLNCDQRFYGRPDPDDGSSPSCDIGAYESDAVPLPTPTPTATATATATATSTATATKTATATATPTLTATATATSTASATATSTTTATTTATATPTTTATATATATATTTTTATATATNTATATATATATPTDTATATATPTDTATATATATSSATATPTATATQTATATPTVTATATQTATATATPTTTATDTPTATATDTATATPTATPTTSISVAASLAMGNSPVGNTVTRNLTLRNTGTNPLFVGNVTSNDPEFAATGASTCPPSGLAHLATCTITIGFTPSALGARSATLSINDNTATSPQSVAVTGTGTITTAVTPASYEFGDVKDGSKKVKAIVVDNHQSSAISLSEGFSGANPSDFTVTGGTCTSTLAAKKACSLIVTFAPTAVGAESATMTVTDSTDPLGPYTVSFTAMATVPESLSAPKLAFSNVYQTASKSLNITVTNKATSGPITLTGASIGGANAGDFAVTGGTCGSSLAASSSCTYAVTFTPSTETAESGTLSIGVAEDPNGGPPAVTLTGTGLAPVKVFPTAGVAFGTVASGHSSADKTVTIYNYGGAAVSLSDNVSGPNLSDFIPAGGTCGATLAGGGAHCTYLLKFTPSIVGPESATLGVTAAGDAASPHDVSLTGTGS